MPEPDDTELAVQHKGGALQLVAPHVGVHSEHVGGADKAGHDDAPTAPSINAGMQSILMAVDLAAGAIDGEHAHQAGSDGADALYGTSSDADQAAHNHNHTYQQVSMLAAYWHANQRQPPTLPLLHAFFMWRAGGRTKNGVPTYWSCLPLLCAGGGSTGNPPLRHDCTPSYAVGWFCL